MKGWLTACLVLLACIASGANAQDSGIVRIVRLRIAAAGCDDSTTARDGIRNQRTH
jgi:hypothetical protein